MGFIGTEAMRFLSIASQLTGQARWFNFFRWDVFLMEIIDRVKAVLETVKRRLHFLNRSTKATIFRNLLVLQQCILRLIRDCIFLSTVYDIERTAPW